MFFKYVCECKIRDDGVEWVWVRCASAEIEREREGEGDANISEQQM
jgi:hypothetical protein